jgi:hypothetical protein
MNESQLTDDLRAALDEVTAGLRATPGMAVRARAKGRRRRTTRGLLAGVPVLALAAGTVVALHGSAPASGVGVGDSVSANASGQSKAVTEAYVVKRAEAALANADNYILTETGIGAYERLTSSMIDPRTSSFYTRPGNDQVGKSATWSGTYWRNGYQHFWATDVNYTNRTWWSNDESSTGKSTPNTAPVTPGGSPSDFAQDLKDGVLKLTGRRAEINGRQAIELVRGSKLPPNIPPQLAKKLAKAIAKHRLLPTGSASFWIDAQTYLLLRIGTGSGTVNETWTPRTPALTQLVNHPVIPAGFRHISAPPES